MNFIRSLLISFIFLTSLAHAEDQPLVVGVESFDPPFVAQGAHHEIYGFDIDMMSSICRLIHRKCHFHLMNFDQLLNAVATKKVDVAVAAMTITPERAKIVSFSIPYLVSYSRFITFRSNVSQTPFSYSQLDGKKIGIEAGTVYGAQIAELKIKDPIIVEYKQGSELLLALSNKDIDYVLLDNPGALYWEANSGNQFVTVGQPLMHGFGCGIAINQGDQELLKSINQAILQYQSSSQYKIDYDKYLLQF